jgi:hypothetical protein
MSEDLDVHLLVIIDNVDHYTEDHNTEIVKSLHTIDGLTTARYANGTNVIYVAANWKESELDNKIKEVKNTPNVKNVIITGKHRVVERSIQEKTIEIKDKVTKKKSWPITKQGVWVLGILAGIFVAIDLVISIFYYDEARLLGILGIEFTIGVGVLIFVIQLKVENHKGYSRV